MKIAAFNQDGSCGVMKNTLNKVLEELISQDAYLLDYTYYYVIDEEPLELALIGKLKTSKP